MFVCNNMHNITYVIYFTITKQTEFTTLHKYTI